MAWILHCVGIVKNILLIEILSTFIILTDNGTDFVHVVLNLTTKTDTQIILFARAQKAILESNYTEMFLQTYFVPWYCSKEDLQCEDWNDDMWQSYKHYVYDSIDFDRTASQNVLRQYKSHYLQEVRWV